MWKLSIADDQGQRTTVTLARDEYTLGRADGNAIRLTERNVSRRHARIERWPGGFRIEDLGSYTGLYVNGVRVNSFHELATGDLLQIGDYRIEVIDEDLSTQEQAHRPISAHMPALGRLPERLVVLIGPNQGTEFPIEAERCLIGRGEECDIILDHASVSRVHAEVRRIDAEHLEILDKGSANGLRVNSRDLPRAVLDGRDVIEVGDVVLKYIPKGQMFRVTAAEGARLAAMAGVSPSHPSAKAQLGAGRSLIAALVGAGVAAGLTAYFLLVAPKKASSVVVPPAHRSGQDALVLPEGALPVLDEAEARFRAGRVQEAHELIQKFPKRTQLVVHPVVRSIEVAWAEKELSAAAEEPQAVDKRARADLVAKTETVPLELRQKALSLVSSLSERGLSLEEVHAKDPGEPEDAP